MDNENGVERPRSSTAGNPVFDLWGFHLRGEGGYKAIGSKF
jgi:hypothetical protein